MADKVLPDLEHRFLTATEQGSLANVKTCIAAGVNVEAKDNNGGTALFYASRYGHLEIVQYLLQNGNANVEAKTNGGMTALHWASDNGDLKVVQYLLQNGNANVEAKSNNGWTALHLASNKGHLEIVQYLLQNGNAHVEAKNNDGWTALHFASCMGHLEFVQYLIQNGNANVEAKTNDGWTAFHLASRNGYLEIVQYLLQNGNANVEKKNNHGWTALHLTSLKGHLDVVQYLVQHCKANAHVVTKNNETPLDVAKQAEKTEIVEYLSTMQITPVVKKKLPAADKQVSSADVNEYIVAGVNVEAKTDDRSTALHLASSFAQKYSFRANIDFELNQLQILINDGLQVHATVAAIEAACEAEEHKEALLMLCQTDDYATVESLQQQLEKVKLDIEKSQTLSERIPFAKHRDELQSRFENELKRAQELHEPSDYKDSSNRLWQAWIAKGPVSIPSLSTSFLQSATRNFAKDRHLGGGGFGDVYLGNDSLRCIQFAVKRHKKELMQNSELSVAREQILQEVHVCWIIAASVECLMLLMISYICCITFVSTGFVFSC
jgi:ankyrin repeat protein